MYPGIRIKLAFAGSNKKPIIRLAFQPAMRRQPGKTNEDLGQE